MVETLAESGSGVSDRERYREAIVATIGNAIEWFDFVVFGFVAVIISRVFFPTTSPAVGLLAAFATFGVGFLARPLGALIFGRIGDRRGRRHVLIVSMSIMAVASFTIGLAPSYAQAGIAGPIILIAGRLLQGISAGAEFGSAIAYLIEWAPAHRRGLFGSFHQLGAAFGLLLGAGLTATVNSAFGPAEVADWAWRLPFLVGGVLALVALRLRMTLRETPSFVAASSAHPAAPVSARDVVIGVLQIIGISAMWTVSIFASVIYMPTYAQQIAGISPAGALWATVAGVCVLIPCVLLGGAAVDRFGVRRVLFVPVVLYVAISVPAFLIVASGTLGYAGLMLVVCAFAVLAGITSGAGPVAIAQIFSVRDRSTWTSIGSALSITVFGGFAPLLCTLLITATGWSPAPSLYIVLMALVTGLAVYSLPGRGARTNSDVSIEPILKERTR